MQLLQKYKVGFIPVSSQEGGGWINPNIKCFHL